MVGAAPLFFSVFALLSLFKKSARINWDGF